MNASKTHITRIMSSLLILVLLTAMSPLMIPAEASSGNSYFVALDGNDANPGTLEEPWGTVQHAVNNVNPGDAIYLREGTYFESVEVQLSGADGAWIELLPYNSEAVTLHGGEGPAIVDWTGTQYWSVGGLTFDSNADYALQFDAWGCDGTCGGSHNWQILNNVIIGAVKIYGSNFLFEGNEVDGSQHKGNENGVRDFRSVSHHNVYRNNEIHDFQERGIWSMQDTHDNLIEGNYIHNIGDGSTSGMCIDTDGFGSVEYRHVIRGNTLHDCGEAGIELENTFASIVENNIIYDTGKRGIHVINYGPTIESPGAVKCTVGGENNQYGDTNGDNSCEGDLTGNVIRQNLIYNGASKGAIVILSAGGVTISGNTIVNASGPGLHIDRGVEFTPGIRFFGNVLSNNGETEVSLKDINSLSEDHHNLFNHINHGSVYQETTSWTRYTLQDYQNGTGKGQSSVEDDPQFVDAGSNNFRLRISSRGVDAGADLGLSSDLDGQLRPLGAAMDMGAYEREGASLPTVVEPTPTEAGASPTTEPIVTTEQPTVTAEPTATAAQPTETTEPTPTAEQATETVEPTATPAVTETASQPTSTVTSTTAEPSATEAPPTATDEPTASAIGTQATEAPAETSSSLVGISISPTTTSNDPRLVLTVISTTTPETNVSVQEPASNESLQDEAQTAGSNGASNSGAKSVHNRKSGLDTMVDGLVQSFWKMLYRVWGYSYPTS